MKNENIIITTYEDIKKAFVEWSAEIDANKVSTLSRGKTMSINQVAKQLGRAHPTIKKLILEGVLESTADKRRVLVVSLNAYISEKNIQ